MKYIIVTGNIDVQAVADANADSLIALGVATLSTQELYNSQQAAKTAANNAITAANNASVAAQASARTKLIALGFTEAEANVIGGTPPAGSDTDPDVSTGGQG